MTLLTREEIRTILEPYRIAGKPWPDDLINALFDARLRPGWERMDQELTTLKAVLSPDTYDADAQVEKIAALGKLADAILAERDALRADLRQVAEALKKYGAHLPSCPARYVLTNGCDCGLEAVVKRPGVQAGLK